MENYELATVVRNLLWEQLFGILATAGARGPHSTIVSFAAADDLKTILFATPRKSRKFENLTRNASVSLFIDSRSNTHEALFEIWGVEARGIAVELFGTERATYELLYREKHPTLASFAEASALIMIHVERYDLVNKFQNVTMLDVGDSREEYE